MKKIVFSAFVGFLVAFVATVLLQGCGPTWNDCPTCQVDEDQAESIDGGTTLPIVVIVNVNVDVDQTQTQTQVQGQGQTQSNTNNTYSVGVDAGSVHSPPDAGTPPKVDAGVPDAGKPPAHDAGVPPKVDAGTPPKVDAGCAPVCRTVCTCYEVRYVCKSGKDTNKKDDCNSCGVSRTYNKCTKEVTQCK